MLGKGKQKLPKLLKGEKGRKGASFLKPFKIHSELLFRCCRIWQWKLGYVGFKGDNKFQVYYDVVLNYGIRLLERILKRGSGS